jgi:hypothetical protein
METLTESRKVEATGEILTGLHPDSSSFETEILLRSKSIVSESARNHAKTSAGVFAIIALALLPIFVLPGLAVLVLLAEVYLIDWTYSNVTAKRIAEQSTRERSGTGPSVDTAGERSKIVTTTSAKDQFIK